jgi:protein O-GlcNAc transferase
MQGRDNDMADLNRRDRRQQEKLERGKVKSGGGLESIDAQFDHAANLQDGGQLAEAEALCHAILRTEPLHANTINLLGVIYCQSGRAEIGIQLIDKAILINPNEASYHNNRGTALTGRCNFVAALDAFKRGLALQPNYAQAHNNIGAVLRPLGRHAEAADHYRNAIRLRPDYAEAYANLANVLVDLNLVEEARAAAERAVALKPDYAIGHNNLGAVLQRYGQYGKAIEALCRALELRPAYPDALCNMGEVLKESGRAAEAIGFYRKAIELSPDEAGMGSNMLLALCNIETLTPAMIFEEHRAWGKIVSARVTVDGQIDPFENRDHSSARRLRVGYLSSDFRRHSVAYFLEPILEFHNPKVVESVCYSNLTGPGDSVTERLRGFASDWCDVAGLNDASLTKLIRDDEIDILVDLSGHTRGNRLSVFARRAAPLQMSYLGYPATTGLATVDWRLSDSWADPLNMTEAFHSERVLHLANGFLCYRPDPEAPEVEPPPVFGNGHITFGSFNSMAKLTPTAIKTWAQILLRVPGSRLVLKSKAISDPDTRRRLYQRFAERRVDADRLGLFGWVVDGDPLTAYHGIDIGLDSFPYNGTTTTCEAMWMGVPVIALAGDWHAARVGVSLLTRTGMDAFLARSPENYVDIAVNLASRPEVLAELRRDMREKIIGSGLCDGPAFVGQLERAYRSAWRAWCDEV